MTETTTHVFKIEVRFATEFQRDSALPTLRALLKSWADATQEKHQKNSVSVKEIDA
jgi:hypothetical protein